MTENTARTSQRGVRTTRAGIVLRKTANRLLSVLIVSVAYQTASLLKHSPAFPSITTIIDAWWKILQSQKFYDNAAYTLRIVAIGVLVAFIGGNVIAIICNASKIANRAVMPIINTMKNIPSIALFPVFIVLMGIGDLPRIFVIIWNSAYPIISSTMSGLSSVDQEIIDAAQNACANEWQMYRHIRIPLSTIRILEGLKISVSNGFIAIVVAEMLGATKGLGYMIVWSTNAFKYPEMYAYILTIAFLGLAINAILERFIRSVERRLYS